MECLCEKSIKNMRQSAELVAVPLLKGCRFFQYVRKVMSNPIWPLPAAGKIDDTVKVKTGKKMLT